MIHGKYDLPPAVEAERMRAVEQLYLLDSAPEDRFAQITRMARIVFELPMAAVSLLDSERQWFKQADGLDLEGSVPRAQTVCQATILRGYEHPEDPALILEDTWESGFCELPAICAPGGIRFYAGYPLYGPGGYPVGTFCVYDTKPRQFSPAQLESFVELAAWAQRELQSTDDLERAATVQRQLLPRAEADVPGYRVCALCLPAFAVGGDFYDHYPVEGGTVFTVADVMGKGLGAAILTATVRAALRGASRGVHRTGALDLGDAVTVAYQQIAVTREPGSKIVRVSQLLQIGFRFETNQFRQLPEHHMCPQPVAGFLLETGMCLPGIARIRIQQNAHVRGHFRGANFNICVHDVSNLIVGGPDRRTPGVKRSGTSGLATDRKLQIS
nr:GAF domain-containing protein [Mycolicibacterium poriferae]